MTRGLVLGRAPWAGMVGGATLLATLVAFAVGLDGPPGDPGSRAAGGPAVVLPDQVRDLYALDGGELPREVLEELADAATISAAQTEAAARVAELFEAETSFRIYADETARRLAIVTVLERPPGLFVPDGPPVARNVLQPSYDVIAVDGAVCAVYSSLPPPEGAASPPGAGDEQLQVVRSHCQLGDQGRTYDVDAQGFGPDEVVAMIREIAQVSAEGGTPTS